MTRGEAGGYTSGTGHSHRMHSRNKGVGMRVARTATACVALAVMVLLAGCASDPAFTSGKVYLQQEDYASAIEQFQIAIRNNPEAWEPHMFLGRAYADTDELQLSHDEFFRALDLAPDAGSKETVNQAITYYWQLYRNEGNQYNSGSKFEQAIDEFKKAIVIDPRKFDAYANLGYAYHMSRRYEEAVEAFEQALELEPDNEDLKANLVSVYESKAGDLAAMNDTEGALRYFEKIELVAPDTPDILYNIGLMHYELKQYREALGYFTRHVDEFPEDEEVLYRIFLVHWAVGKQLEDDGLEEDAKDEFGLAIDPLNRLIDINDTELTYHRALARIYNKLGRDDEAMHELTIVEELLRGE